MTYIKHNGLWKRTTGVTIRKYDKVTEMMSPGAPALIDGVTRTVTGTNAVYTDATATTTAIFKNRSFGSGSVPGGMTLDFSAINTKKILMYVKAANNSINGAGTELTVFYKDGTRETPISIDGGSRSMSKLIVAEKPVARIVISILAYEYNNDYNIVEITHMVVAE